MDDTTAITVIEEERMRRTLGRSTPRSGREAPGRREGVATGGRAQLYNYGGRLYDRNDKLVQEIRRCDEQEHRLRGHWVIYVFGAEPGSDDESVHVHFHSLKHAKNILAEECDWLNGNPNAGWPFAPAHAKGRGEDDK